ncbi:hypothetical protein H4P12_17930 [Paracoccus sp. 11-3]|uniref:Uncharacterized protein n=1 Tax=Paracoccus amoyensis TaxID=2760093 RepID=A0A926JDT4_9RHOB|nr:hypothetical protein [Paracoccus amoyensis]MBC9248545.1 hypothetical protein [Paracoccus amoyensis]
MIIVALFFIVAGSVMASTTACFLGASWGMIALAYLGGGWTGLLIGMPATLVVSCLRKRHGLRMSGEKLKPASRR